MGSYKTAREMKEESIMMKKRALTSIVPVLAVSLLWPALAGAADPMSGSPSAGSAPQEVAPGAAANQPGDAPSATAPSAVAAPTLPADWTKVKGTVQEINLMDRQVKIQDEKGNLSQVTIDTDVTISKAGKSVSMSQLQQGDKIVLTRKKNAGDYSNKG